MMRAQQPTRSTPTLLGRNMLVALLAVCGPLVAAVPAQQVRYIQQNGVAYRETRQTGYRTICTTEMRPSQRIVYREQCETQTREVTRTWWTPVIECRWEAQWVNRWNPFAQPYLVYRPVERVRWEQRTETVQVPVVVRKIVPEVQTVQVPVIVRRTVPEEVVTRVVASPPGAARLAPVVAGSNSTGGPIGGVARLDRDPPRQGVRTAWRPSGPTR